MSTENAEARNLATAQQYFAALEQRADESVIAALLHPDLIQEEFPNRLNPRGARSDRSTMLARLAQGRQLLVSERYEVVSALAAGEQVAAEVRWSGTLVPRCGHDLPSSWRSVMGRSSPRAPRHAAPRLPATRCVAPGTLLYLTPHPRHAEKWTATESCGRIRLLLTRPISTEKVGAVTEREELPLDLANRGRADPLLGRRAMAVSSG